MPDPASDLSLIRAVVAKLFPWLAWFTIDAKSNGLAINSESTLVHIGGDSTDPAAARKGDFVARFYRDTITSTLYVSLTPESPYTWTPVASGIIAPLPTDAGTPISVSAGSGKVTIA